VLTAHLTGEVAGGTVAVGHCGELAGSESQLIRYVFENANETNINVLFRQYFPSKRAK
jgi:hypothetical protein